jgi:hypothetical protein
MFGTALISMFLTSTALATTWTILHHDPSPLVLEQGEQSQYQLNKPSLGMLGSDALTLEMRFEDADHILKLQRFTVTDERTKFVIGDKYNGNRVFDFNPASVILLKGTVDDDPESSAYLAISEYGALGFAQFDGTSWSLSPTSNHRGLASENLRWHRHLAMDRPPLGVPICGAFTEDFPPAPPRSLDNNTNRVRLDLAIETDYEYLQIFEGDTIAAAQYIVALYGAVASIYERDVDAEIVVVFSRLWDTPEDLFNEDDPLGPFVDYWNKEMTEIDRDLAQFLTGRTNLPYGGVAFLNAICSGNGYSVAGYVLGSFYSTTQPNFGNWDVIVTSHELGHNCGTSHTHNYGIDNCDSGAVNRGSIMSYCHTTTGGNANIDLRFHEITQSAMREHIEEQDCLAPDCNGNGQDDAFDVLLGESNDFNLNGIPDECEDCNENGVFDEQDIADGFSSDLDTNGIPDECQADCNNNSVPDTLDIEQGVSEDLWGNGVPDECEADCDGDGQSDYNQIQVNMSLDINRNALLDNCEDCDDDGIPDHLQLQGGSCVWIAGSEEVQLKAFHPGSGVQVAQTLGENVGDGRDVCIVGDALCVSDGSSDRVVVFDRNTLSFMYSISTGLSSPEGMVVDDEGYLLVVSRGTNSIERYDLQTQSHLGDVVPSGSGGLNQPIAIMLTQDNAILVTSDEERVLEFTIDGTFVRELVAPGEGGLVDPRGLLQRPSGSLLVTSYGTNSILEYDRNGGEFLGRFDHGGLPSGYWGLGEPWALRLGPDGDVYVSTHGANTAIQVYEESTGLFKRRFYILSQFIGGASGFAFAPPAEDDCDGNLVLDSCDIASGVHEDVNGDGVPDMCQCIPDINGDGYVNVTDLLVVIDQWGLTDSPADLNQDGIVDVTDLLIVVGNWGPCE